METELFDFYNAGKEWQDNPEELSALFDELCAACEPANQWEIDRLQRAFFNLKQARRERNVVERFEEELIVDTKNRFYDLQERWVKDLTAELATQPAATVATLKESAVGCQWLIDGWVQIESLIEREAAWAGADRDIVIARNAHDPSRQCLSPEETERLTRVYGLLAQGEPAEREILAFYADTSLLPEGAKSPSPTSLPRRSQCRQRVRAVIERELPPLRAHCRMVQVQVDDPVLEDIVIQRVSDDYSRGYFLRVKRMYDRSFLEVYNRLTKKTSRRKSFALEYPLLAAEIEATRLRRKVNRRWPC